MRKRSLLLVGLLVGFAIFYYWKQHDVSEEKKFFELAQRLSKDSAQLKQSAFLKTTELDGFKTVTFFSPVAPVSKHEAKVMVFID